MEQFIKIGLPLYYIFYLVLAVILPIILTGRKIKKNPMVIPNEDNAQGVIGKFLGMALLVLVIYVLLHTFQYSDLLLSFDRIINEKIQFIGISIMLLALILIVIAQYNMDKSWRIGIDNEDSTELVSNGLFKYSRNPIFLGMIASQLGLFLLTPNVWTLYLLIIAYMLIQIHIRLEEAFLLEKHGKVYLEYKSKVRRYF